MHDHAHGIRGSGSRRLLTISLCLTATVMLVQIVGAILTGSLALLADAAHMFTDASALVIALIASTVAARPADDRRTFGYQRAEVLGALVNAIILIVLSVSVGIEGVRRLVEPADTEVAGPLMLVVAVIGLAANAIAMWLLSSAQRTNINVRGAYLEVLGDMIGSAAVIVAAIIIVTTGWMPADAIASLFIAVMIIPRAITLLREVFSVLAESAPKDTHVSEIRDHLLGFDGVTSVHDVHVWQLTRGAPVFSAHVGVDQAVFAEGRAGALLEQLQGCLADHFDVEHSTFQLEPDGQAECAETHA
ncbi:MULTISPECIES: cation diffusion facilitator family transporter [unclassified Microbacterium]|uniref:cation diffusion facilitator family transporter n=1 Tax=unclassified Microbacterium TaxID=2609290 RepID=UPI001DE5802E|nr:MULTISPECIES: cation diffusion facilitator family transporter [unclassified Microbacterium]CAH0207849.1 Metal cation efflux system protein CzcD [Microbacterium sp. Bi121]HWK78927.1 cation diffusion facilitator family transporter [Microbacterium sp.]